MLKNLKYCGVFTLPINERIIVHAMLGMLNERDIAAAKQAEIHSTEADELFLELNKDGLALAPVRKKSGRPIDPNSVASKMRRFMEASRGTVLAKKDILAHLCNEFPTLSRDIVAKRMDSAAHKSGIVRDYGNWTLPST